MVVKHAICKISMFYLVTETEQAGLRCTWSETLETGFLMPRLIYDMDLHNSKDTYTVSIVHGQITTYHNIDKVVFS